MRRPALLIFTNACILILVFVLLAQSLFIVQRVALARNVAGDVTVQRGGVGGFQPLGAGEAVKSGDIVRTGAKSEAEFGWQNGTRWKMSPHSQLKIEKAQFHVNQKNEVSRFRLEKGQVLLRVARAMTPASRFEIETPGALASVRGTVFRMSVEKGVTQVRVFQGDVEVFDANRAAKSSIAPGQKVRASLLEFKTSADCDQSDFLAEPTFLKPELRVKARRVGPDMALLSGQTEVGDALTIDGARVPLLGNGSFVKRLKIGPKSAGWKIESTDRYGVKTTVWKDPPALISAED